MSKPSAPDSRKTNPIHAQIQALQETLAHLEASLLDGDGKSELSKARQQFDQLHSQIEGRIMPAETSAVGHESILAEVFEHAPVAIAVFSGPDRICRLANRRYRQALPYADIHPIGLPITTLWPGENFKAVEWYDRVYNQQKPFSRDNFPRQYPDGTVRYFSLRAEPILWEMEPGVIVIGHETTAVVEAGKQAIDSERILNALMTYIPEGITIADAPDVKIRQVSAFGRQLTGRSAEVIEGIPMETHSEVWQIYNPDGVTLAAPERLPLSRATLTGEVVQNEELIIRRPDGTGITILCNAGPILDDTGQITGGLIAWRDISERKHIEAERERLIEANLRERELLQRLIDTIPVMIVMFQPSLQVTTVNKAFEEIAGWTNAEIQDLDVMAACYPDPTYRQMVADFMGQLSGWMDIRMTIKDGSQIETSWSNIRLNDDTNIGIGLDIRERKQAERALRESEARFRALADNIAQFAWMADPSGWIYWYNKRWFDFTGTTLEEMQGWGWQKVHHPDYVEAVTRKFKQHVEAGLNWEDTFPLRSKSGEYRWFLSRAFPIFDENGQVLRWFGTNTDITEQLQTQEALRVSEEHFRLALDGSPIVIFTMDQDLRYIWIYNARNGFLQQDVIGKRDDELLPPEAANILTRFKQAVLESGAIQSAELTYHTGQEIVTYNITAEPRRNEQGEIIGLTAAAIDVSEIRRMEQQAIEQRARIEVQRRLIAQREEERARIAREIHDGPVQSLSALLFDLAEIDWIEDQAERSAKIVMINESVQAQIKDLRSMCNELRPSTLHSFGLEKAIRSHIETLEERYLNTRFILDLAPDRLSIQQNVRLELYRIFQEAVNNALKHGAPREVHIRLAKAGRTVQMEVRDDGRGFVFNPRREEYARQGSLGLIGMQERAELIGARIEIQSVPEEGSCVLVTLELQEP